MEKAHRKSLMEKFLDKIEYYGGKIPHPLILFLCLSLLVIILSGIGEWLKWQVKFSGVNTKTKEIEEMVVSTKSLMSKEGITFIFTTMVKNFTGFAPLGTVLVVMLGIGLTEGVGLMEVVIRKIALKTSEKYIVPVVIFLGVMSNVASDAGYYVLPPLAAIIFISFNKHPIAGMIAAFAGVSGGYSANLLLGTVDPMLGGISQEAARLINPSYTVYSVANWYFMALSVPLIVFLGTIVNNKIIEPRLGEYKSESKDDGFIEHEVKDSEKLALRSALWALIIILILFVPLYMLLGHNFLGEGLVPIIFIFFAVPAIAYGRKNGTINKATDAIQMMVQSMVKMAPLITVIAFSAQFSAYFKFSNLGTILAVKGGELLEKTKITGIPLIIAFILLIGLVNLVLLSASSKWVLLAPIFVPMFMRVGYTPEFTQLAYRIGDSVTNIISPLMSALLILSITAQKYDKKSSIGTMIAHLIPYSAAFFIGWTVMLIIWQLLGLPIGPGASIRLA